MAAFCHYWHFSVREVDEMTADEYWAFCRYANRDIRAQIRAARKGR